MVVVHCLSLEELLLLYRLVPQPCFILCQLFLLLKLLFLLLPIFLFNLLEKGFFDSVLLHLLLIDQYLLLISALEDASICLKL